MAPKRLYILTGEVSGDLHAANLLRELKQHQPDVQVRGLGGDRLQAEGMALLRHIDSTSFMGFVEVAMNLRRINKMFAETKRDIAEFQPDAILFVDYPGFNLRMAKWAHANDYQTIWYISPKVWAWGQGRIPKLKARIDHLLTILPFEQPFYREHGMEVAYVGNPLLDAIEQEKPGEDSLYDALQLDKGKPVTALLPGSRTKEITRMLPTMLRLAKRYPRPPVCGGRRTGQIRGFLCAISCSRPPECALGPPPDVRPLAHCQPRAGDFRHGHPRNGAL